MLNDLSTLAQAVKSNNKNTDLPLLDSVKSKNENTGLPLLDSVKSKNENTDLPLLDSVKSKNENSSSLVQLNSDNESYDYQKYKREK